MAATATFGLLPYEIQQSECVDMEHLAISVLFAAY